MVVNIMVPDYSVHPERHQAFFRVKDPMSALTHFLGFAAAIFATPLLLLKGATDGLNLLELFSLSVFALSMVFLYGASTAYHSFLFMEERTNLALKKLDHMMIAILVAGTYTPLCVITLKAAGGIRLLTLVWSLGIAAIVFKAFWVTCPKWISSVIYLLMGWAVAPHLKEVYGILTQEGFQLLLHGGISYTIGALVYVLKIPPKSYKGFGSHEIFHLFVLLGTALHFLMIYRFVA